MSRPDEASDRARPAVGDIYIIVSGRWDDDIAAVSLKAAIDPANSGTSRAVVSRPRVTADLLAGRRSVRACGLPVSIAVAPTLERIFVVNHAGAVAPEAAARMPHGHLGSIAILDIARTLDRAHDGGLGALVATVPLWLGGPVGCAMTPDGRHLLVASGEGEGTEDGGHVVAALEAETGEIAARWSLGASGLPCGQPSPHLGFGGFPNPAGIAVTPSHGGLVFTANGGTDDVAIVPVADVLAGRSGGGAIRIPVESGPFGLDVSADGAVLAVANRESARTGVEGGSITLIDVATALVSPHDAVIAHVPVGGSPASRPMTVAFSADGSTLFVVCYRTGTLSRIALAGAGAGAQEGLRVRLRSTDGAAPCPRGVHVAPGGLIVVAGGARGASGSSRLWIFDPATLDELGHVTGVGNESYLLTSSNAEAHGDRLRPASCPPQSIAN